MENHYAFWDKTLANLENNIEYDKQAPHNYINHPKTFTIDGDEVMLLGDDILQTAHRSFLNQA